MIKKEMSNALDILSQMTHQNINKMKDETPEAGLDIIAKRTSQVNNYLCEFNNMIEQIVLDDRKAQATDSYEQRMQSMMEELSSHDQEHTSFMNTA